MKRRRASEVVERFRCRDVADQAEPLHQSLVSWAEATVDTLAEARPEIPEGLGDRAADVWEPLLAIADMAGGHWPETARAAALELSRPVEADEESAGVRLLSDIRDVFDERGIDRIASAALVESLREIEDGPWAEWHKGRGLTTNSLASLLRRFDIRSRNVRIRQEVLKGFHLEQFEDPFGRYLSARPPFQSATTLQPASYASLRPSSSRYTHDDVAASNAPETAWINGCSGVAAQNGGTGEKEPDEDEIERLARLFRGTIVEAE
jgi:putative DNA primase/helicase